MLMPIHDFEVTKDQFQKADTDTKVEIYTNTEGLTPDQYEELLKLFPINQIELLDVAL